MTHDAFAFEHPTPHARARVVGGLPSRVDLGAHLASLRGDYELTVDELADAVGLTAVAVARIEAGATGTTTGRVMRWLEVCGIDDPEDRERWLDPYRLVVRDARHALTAGVRTIVEAASIRRTRRTRGEPTLDIPGVDLDRPALVGWNGWTPPTPKVVGWDPDAGDEFRAAVAAAETAHRDHWRTQIEQARARLGPRTEAHR